MLTGDALFVALTLPRQFFTLTLSRQFSILITAGSLQPHLCRVRGVSYCSRLPESYCTSLPESYCLPLFAIVCGF